MSAVRRVTWTWTCSRCSGVETVEEPLLELGASVAARLGSAEVLLEQVEIAAALEDERC